MLKSFGSDNHSGVHPEVMESLMKINSGDCVAYGNDEYTRSISEKIESILGADKVFFVLNGIGANILSLRATTKPYQAILCASSAHINIDECGAVERNVGSKLIVIPTNNGKITSNDLKSHIKRLGNQHAVQPKIVSITQATEWGTVYTIQELKELCNFAHDLDFYVHMDGARLYNAAAYLELSLQELTASVGVDVLSLGGSKNGTMFGDIVACFKKGLADDLQYLRTQQTQLTAKMRFIAAQFDALFTDDLWLRNAQHANKIAQLLATELRNLDIDIVQKTEINQIFACLPLQKIDHFQKQYRFYTWDSEKQVVRLMTSFNTTKEDVMTFVNDLKKVMLK